MTAHRTLLPRTSLTGDSTVVAPTLLGKLLVAGTCVARISEVEAYRQDDPASHSYRGRTPRTATMFGPPGGLYVYLSYGIHYCSNIVTGAEGDGAAVLLRAAEPLEGLEQMTARRGRVPLCAGPGRLTQALGIDKSFDGVDVCDPASVVRVYDDGVAPVEVSVGPRVGISVAKEQPWRWRARFA